MSLAEFKERIQDLNTRIKEQVTLFDEEVYPIYDGALHETEYFYNNPIKILWLMKEPYEKEDREGSWSLSELYEYDYNKFYKELIIGKHRATWQPVVYVSYGILNDFVLWDDIPFIRNKPEIAKELSKVAWVNIQKLPSITAQKTEIGNIYEGYRNHSNLINEQIELLNPNVIICGNTFQVIKEDWGLSNIQKYNSVEFAFHNNCIVVNTYHPAQRTIKREQYVNDIINCIKIHYPTF